MSGVCRAGRTRAGRVPQAFRFRPGVPSGSAPQLFAAPSTPTPPALGKQWRCFLFALIVHSFASGRLWVLLPPAALLIWSLIS